jgi:hypothetical protein
MIAIPFRAFEQKLELSSRLRSKGEARSNTPEFSARDFNFIAQSWEPSPG